jgi:hypothetical protein
VSLETFCGVCNTPFEASRAEVMAGTWRTYAACKALAAAPGDDPVAAAVAAEVAALVAERDAAARAIDGPRDEGTHDGD